MLTVGLTGNIASGKSTVAARFAALGATIIDADLLAREVVRPGSPALARIVEHFGREILARDGTLNRAALRSRVFSQPHELDVLNAIVHPAVGRRRIQLLNEAVARRDKIVVCDIPLLFETHSESEFDRVVLVDAPPAERLARLLRDRGLTETVARDMIAAQLPSELKRPHADFIIDNEGSLDDLLARTDAVWSALAVTQ
jgi:dephospho-CoA kinase